jgi:flavoprotein
MPLDANKTAHIQAATLKTFQGRQKTVVFVYQASGTYSYSAVQVIFRPQAIIDPEIPNLAGHPPQQQFDMLMVAPITTNFVGVVYIADTTTASAGAVAVAAKYEIIEALPVGIVPGGTHYLARLRRLR